MLLGLFGVVLIALAAVVYQRLRPARAAAGPDGYPVRLRCTSCGYTVTVRVPVAQRFPAVCQRCGETSAEPLWQCRVCGAVFVAEERGAEVTCVECGSRQVGSAAAP